MPKGLVFNASLNTYDGGVYTSALSYNDMWCAWQHAWQAALQSGEPVGWQFYDNGKWFNGMPGDHRANTEAAGIPVRDLYATPQLVVPEAEELARMFHETYESLAEVAGYETRLETRSFNLESPNGRLMVLVCAEIRKALLSAGKGGES
jgi:hypothetical protein